MFKGEVVTKLTELSDSLETTLRDSNLHAITANMAELLVDSFLEDGLVKNIPVISTLFNIGKLTGNIRDRLFAKKLLYFLSELSSTTSEQRADVLHKLEVEKGYRGKVGEKLLYIVDRFEDHTKAQVVARLFAAFICKKLSFSEFLRAPSIVDSVYLDDLETFIHTTEERANIDEVGLLLNSGRYNIESPEISIRDQDDYKMANEPYIVEGTQLTVYITEIGKKIRKILGETS